jgi:hypothetical protein
MAPIRAEAGSSLLLSAPVKNLIRWGTIRPTKPIIPETDTHIAVTKDAVTRRIILTLFVSTPREAADLSPNEMISKSREKKKQTAKPIDTNRKVNNTSAHVFEPKLPINQKIIIETCSSAKYFTKLMPADKTAATIIPANMRLTGDIRPSEVDRNITAKRVETAPIKANKGTEYTPKKAAMSKSSTREAPKAAPADTPSV